MRGSGVGLVVFSCGLGCLPLGGGDGPGDGGSSPDARVPDAAPDAGGHLPDCEPGTRDGATGETEGELTPLGVDYAVRTPEGYDATVGHPLLVVYSPAGVTDPVLTEDFTGLTPDARERGYLIAYVNHVAPATQADIDDAGLVAGLVAERWCVDASRVYLTGHSDGGTTASAIALSSATPELAAIAPGAAGVPIDYLEGQTCPEDLAVMVVHSRNDGAFPIVEGFGAEPARWWATCAGCDGAPSAPRADGCIAYTGCAGGAEVQYCEGDGPHSVWPPLNASMFDFFDRFTRE